MAGVRQLGWKAIPAVRSEYGADTLPDRYRSDGRCRSARTAVHHARRRDRYRRTRRIFLSETDCTKRSFRCVIVRLRQTVITEVAQRNPVLPDIPERISQTAFFDNVCSFSCISLYRGSQQRFTLHLPDRRAFRHRQPAYFVLNGVQFTD